MLNLFVSDIFESIILLVILNMLLLSGNKL